MRKTLFLSASVPDEKQPRFLEWGVQAVVIKDSVTALRRLCLEHHTRLILGGHPSILELIAPIALEKVGSESSAEALIYVYQSEAFRGQHPGEIDTLSGAGAAHIVWTAAVADDDARFSRSLALMRQQMIRDQAPEVMVCIGGMQGVLDELEEFKRQFPERRAFVLPGTGGAASLLARMQVDVIESGALDRIFAPATMSERQAKRLDHLQAIISRMADNSFKLKGWCLTLVSAFLGLALKTDAGAAPTSQIAFFAVLPIVVFWLLDAYYLALERGFRHVYNESAKNPVAAEQGIAPTKMTLGRTLNVARDPVTAALYIALLVMSVVVGCGGATKVIGWLGQVVHLG